MHRLPVYFVGVGNITLGPITGGKAVGFGGKVNHLGCAEVVVHRHTLVGLSLFPLFFVKLPYQSGVRSSFVFAADKNYGLYPLAPHYRTNAGAPQTTPEIVIYIGVLYELLPSGSYCKYRCFGFWLLLFVLLDKGPLRLEGVHPHQRGGVPEPYCLRGNLEDGPLFMSPVEKDCIVACAGKLQKRLPPGVGLRENARKGRFGKGTVTVCTPEYKSAGRPSRENKQIIRREGVHSGGVSLQQEM